MVTLVRKKKMEEGVENSSGSGSDGFFRKGGRPSTPLTPPISTPDSVKSMAKAPERPTVKTIEVPTPPRGDRTHCDKKQSLQDGSEMVRIDSLVSELSTPLGAEHETVEEMDRKKNTATKADPPAAMMRSSSYEADRQSSGQASGGEGSDHNSLSGEKQHLQWNQHQQQIDIVTKVLGIVDLSCGSTDDEKKYKNDVRKVLSFPPQWGMKPDDDFDDDEKEEPTTAANFQQNAKQAALATTRGQREVGTLTASQATTAVHVLPASPDRGKRHENFELVYKEPEKPPVKKGVMGKLVEKINKKKNNKSVVKQQPNKQQSNEPAPLGIVRRVEDESLLTTHASGNGAPISKQTKGTTSTSDGEYNMKSNKITTKVAPVVEPLEYQQQFSSSSEKHRGGIFGRKKKKYSGDSDLTEPHSKSASNGGTPAEAAMEPLLPKSSQDESSTPKPRYKKVLKSIKTPNKMQLEAITEEGDDDGAASSTGEIYVRVPGIQSADAYLSDRDLLGEEVVEEIYSDLEYMIANGKDESEPMVVVQSPVTSKSDSEFTKSKVSKVTEQIPETTISKTVSNPANSSVPLKIPDSSDDLEKDSLEIPRAKTFFERIGLKRTGSCEAPPDSNTHSSNEANPATSDTSAETTSSSANKPPPKKPMWKAAVDQNTGKTYYYHRTTRVTTWQKPPDEDLVPLQRPVEVNKVDVADIDNNLTPMSRSSNEFEPEEVWEKKKEITSMLTSIAAPNGESADRFLSQYKGNEDKLLTQLCDLKESKPFDEPLTGIDRTLHLEDEKPLIRTRTAASIYSGFSGKSRISEKTEQIRNTSSGLVLGNNVGLNGSMATSISSRQYGEQPSNVTSPARIPKNIPVPRTRELNVEEFTTSDRVYLRNKPIRVSGGLQGTRSPPRQYHNAMLESNYLGDNEETDKDTISYATDSISALSDADLSSLTDRREAAAIGDARLRALDRAIEQEDWDMAAKLSEIMRINSKQSHYRIKQSQQQQPNRQQSEVDRFISENDWDSVTAYIAHVRSKAKEAEQAKIRHHLSNRLPSAPSTAAMSEVPQPLTPKQSPLASRSFAEVKATPSNVSDGSNNPQKRFGARSQLQHQELNASIESQSSGYSTYDSEYTSESSFTNEEPKQRRRQQQQNPNFKEFAC